MLIRLEVEVESLHASAAAFSDLNHLHYVTPSIRRDRARLYTPALANPVVNESERGFSLANNQP